MTTYILDNQNKRLVDKIAIDEYHLPSAVLIERAALSIYEAIKDKLDFHKHIYLFAGPGNNGADALALARLLYHDHYEVTCVLKDIVSDEAKRQFMIIQKLGLDIKDLEAITINKSDIIIDGLFGSGINKDINGEYQRMVEYINACEAYTISLDIPSGISATDGALPKTYVKADLVIMIDSLPLSKYKYPVMSAYREWRVIDIGFPEIIKEKLDRKVILIDDGYIKDHFPKRDQNANKGTYQKGLLIGGSKYMYGALSLATKAAYHSGIGTLTLYIPDSISDFMANRFDFAMQYPASSKDGYFDFQIKEDIENFIKDYDLIAIGNGMGRKEAAKEILRTVLKSDKRVIVDGDGLWLLKDEPELLKREALTILLPHLKEMSYLSALSIDKIKADPFKVLDDFVMEYPNVYVVLKSSFTIVKSFNETALLDRPNSALAKGGSGDVLCGITMGLLSQSEKIMDALESAVYVHNLTPLDNDPRYLMPEMMITNLAEVYKRING